MQIIRDSREKNGYSFAMLADVTVSGLKCGDYTTPLLLGKVAVERKASTGEVYLNLIKQKNKERFYRELDKLMLLDHACIVFEFPESYLYTFPVNSGIPKSKWEKMGASAKYLRRCVNDIEEYSKIEIVYTNSKEDAEMYIYNYLKNFEITYAGNLPSR